jgi:hypothetical protein
MITLRSVGDGANIAVRGSPVRPPQRLSRTIHLVSHEDDTLLERPAMATDIDAMAERAPTRPRPVRIGPGTKIGRYVVERRLGAGGMGVVYLAHDPDLERRVAIKIVRPGLTTGRTRLLREGQAVARLAHPNVVSVFDVGPFGDDFFIAMEYISGANLDEYLRGPRRPWREVLDLFLAAGRGLGAAHRAGLVHRDFKPDNVLIGDDGRVVVTDFGLVRSDGGPSGDAVIVDDELELTRTAGMVGTPAYMSPEQFQQAPIDARSDQFSFCVALWLGLFGSRPFERGDSKTSDVDQIARAVLSGQIQLPPRDRRVPGRIERALRRGLSVKPEARFPTMDHLLVALRPPDYRPVVMGAVGAAVASGLVAFAATRSTPRPAMAPSSTACDRAGDPVAALWTGEARATYLAGPGDAALATEDAGWFDEFAARWTSTARAVCKREVREARSAACLDDALGALGRALTRRDREMWPELPDPRACSHVRSLSFRELRTALGNIEPSGAISPDGSRLAFTGGDELQALMTSDGESLRADLLAGVSRIYGWAADGRLIAKGGDTVVEIDVDSSSRTGLPWAGDVLAVARDESAAVRRNANGLELLSGNGKVLARVPIPFRAEITAVDIEPGGRRAAVIYNDEGWFLLIADIATGRFVRHRLRVHGDAGGTLALVWSGPGRLVMSGSPRRGDHEALWRVEIDSAGRITAPPAILIPPRTNTVMDLVAVDQQRALVVMVDIPNSVVRYRDGRSTRVPGLLSGIVYGADSTRDRFLLRDLEDDTMRVYGVDGTAKDAGALSLGFPVLYDGDLWFARNDGGDVVLSSTDAAARPDIRFDGSVPTQLDRMRCSNAAPTRCFVSWLPGKKGEVRHALIAGRRVRRTINVPVRERDFDLAADGRHALIHTDNEILIYDTRRRKSRVVYREPDCKLEEAAWSPSGESIYFSAECGLRSEIRTMPAEDGGKVRTLINLDAELTGLAVLGEDDLVYSTIDYESRLVLVDGLPLP